MLIPVLRASPEREQRREGGGEDEGKRGKKEGRHAVKTKAKPVTPAFQTFSEDAEGEVGGFAEWRKASFDVFPFCKMKPVDSQQP